MATGDEEIYLRPDRSGNLWRFVAVKVLGRHIGEVSVHVEGQQARRGSWGDVEAGAEGFQAA